VTNVVTEERAHQYARDGWWDGSTLAQKVQEHARTRPGAVAVVDETTNSRVTYQELWDDACRVAEYLAEDGVGPGDVVSVQLPNWYETVAVDLGVLTRGAVLNPLLPNYRSHELHHILGTARAQILFTPDEFRGFDHAALGRELVRDLDSLHNHVVVRGHGNFWQRVLGRSVTRVEPPADAAALSEVIFTSGTEATPKGVMHTEHTTNCNVRSAYAVNELGPDDVVWAPSPIGHSTGLNFGVRLALYFGMKLVLQDRWDAERAVELIDQERCSYTLAATTFLTDLIAAAARSGRDVSSLTRFGCGGAPVPPEIVRAGADADINVLRIYGLTEALVVSWNRPSSTLEQRMHTDGLALPEVELAVWDEHDEPVAVGTPGEIVVRGPNVCVGLFDDPEREQRIFTADGWLRTGDVGVLDDDGYLAIVGRSKEIIIRGGINVAPREIEDLLMEMPAVQAAAVIGIPDERLGEIGCACVVTDGPITLDEAVAHLRSRDLATYKLPEMLRVVDALPTTPSGKIRKNELRDMILHTQSEGGVHE
jgi:acyl-CoA synthetase (AMP-forming)/AMP-acid ligase II